MRMPPSAAFMRSLLAIALVVAAASGGARATDGAVQLAVPGRANATPSIAAAGAFVAVAWGATPPEGGADVFVAASRDGGRTFAAPVQVNADAGAARLGGEQPPRVALARAASGDPQIVVVWGARAAGTVIRCAWPAPPTAARASAPRSLLQAAACRAIAAGSRWPSTPRARRTSCGSIIAAWPPGPRARRTTTANGVAMAQMSSLYYATVRPTARSRPSATCCRGVCYCCKTAVAIGPAGQVFSAWRHVYEGNLRDIAFTQSRDGGATFSAPARVSEDNWVLAGCPDDGPAMAVDADGVVHIVWPTVIGGDEPTGAHLPCVDEGRPALHAPHARADARQPQAEPPADRHRRRRPHRRGVG